jgi:SdrD B-like protein
MSQEIGHAELQERTQQLLNGPLKHIRAAALAAALLPLASVAAAPAAAQDGCPGSAGVCGVVFNDTNKDGFQDAGETGIEGARVFLDDSVDPIYTDLEGFYHFDVPGGTYTISVLVPQGTLPSPHDAWDDTSDSDGVPDGLGYSLATVTLADGADNSDTDFGFITSPVQQPGTGTPGYWKNHPEAWPAGGITVGGVTYTKTEAIYWLGKVGKDKTTTMFSSLVPAMLNVRIGNDGSCVNSTIADAHKWMEAYGPVGSNVPASSYAWSVGEPLHQQMDAYNNGRLCAPHRN